MRYAVALDYRKFFNEKGFSIVDELFSPKICADILAAAKRTVDSRVSHALTTQRMDIKLSNKTDQKILQGRDVWRNDASIRKILLQPQFTELASELFNRQKIKLAYDHFFSSEDFKDQSSPLYRHLESPLPLAESSSIRNIVGGLILCLKAPDSPTPDEDQTFEHFTLPTTTGSALYFKSTLPIDLASHLHLSSGDYLLVAYGSDTLIYTHNDKDIANHALKDLGYVFGDRLKESTHPLLHA